MNYAQREVFLITLKQQFSDIFTTSKAGKDTAELRFRAQGFIHAGELLEICSRHEVQQLMEQTHIAVFGVTVAERKPSEQARRQQALKLGDYHYFDEPAWSQKKWAELIIPIPLQDIKKQKVNLTFLTIPDSFFALYSVTN